MKHDLSGLILWLAGIEYWHWWAAGAVFALIELFRPVLFCLWLAIAAGLVGLLAWLFPFLGWRVELGAFAVLAGTAAIAGHAYFLRRHARAVDPEAKS